MRGCGRQTGVKIQGFCGASILDMCRTTLNVAGDITAATYVARSEGYELLTHHTPALAAAGVIPVGPSSQEVRDRAE